MRHKGLQVIESSFIDSREPDISLHCPITVFFQGRARHWHVCSSANLLPARSAEALRSQPHLHEMWVNRDLTQYRLRQACTHMQVQPIHSNNRLQRITQHSRDGGSLFRLRKTRGHRVTRSCTAENERRQMEMLLFFLITAIFWLW